MYGARVMACTCTLSWYLPDAVVAMQRYHVVYVYVYALDVPPSSIRVVSDGTAASAMCESVLHEAGVLGIDAEWSDDGTGDPLVQFIQLSTGAQLFLLDVPALTRSDEHARALHDAMGRILGSNRLLKLGLGLRQDLRVLLRCHPALAACAPDKVRPCVDIGELYSPRAPTDRCDSQDSRCVSHRPRRRRFRARQARNARAQ